MKTAIGDGGYVDNEGIVTAVDWIQFLLQHWIAIPKDERPFKRILLLRITPSDSGDLLEPPETSTLLNTFRFLTGPMEAMASVRATSQGERGNMESDLAALYLAEPCDKDANDEEIRNTKMSAFGETPLAKGPANAPSRLPYANQARESALLEKMRSRQLKHPQTQGQDSKSESIPLPSTSETPFPIKASFGPEVATKFDVPVIVKDIVFQTWKDEMKVPLNWKLSTEQKDWYRQAWERTMNDDRAIIGVLIYTAARVGAVASVCPEIGLE